MKADMKRGGFSLVEVIVALMILSVGVLAMGASTGYIMTQIRASELRMERMTAVRQAAETLRGEDWNTLSNYCSSATFATQRYTVSCTVRQPASNLKRVQVVSLGPGYSGGRLVGSLPDTFAISLAQPVTP